jgi:hypothetical protein
MTRVSIKYSALFNDEIVPLSFLEYAYSDLQFVLWAQCPALVLISSCPPKTEEHKLYKPRIWQCLLRPLIVEDIMSAFYRDCFIGLSPASARAFIL